MIAATMLGSPAEPGAMTVRITSGCPLPVVLEWPAHPSGLVMVLEAGRGGIQSEMADTLATELRRAGLGTMVVNLIPDSPGGVLAPSRPPVLAERAKRVVAWLRDQTLMAGLPLGFLGVSDAAAATLAAASELDCAEAIVVWGGEPDQTGDALAGITAPTLMLVRAQGEERLQRHHRALARLGGIGRLVAVTESGPSRTEAGMLAEVARWAAVWFVRYLAMERTWRCARTAAPPRVLSGAS